MAVTVLMVLVTLTVAWVPPAATHPQNSTQRQEKLLVLTPSTCVGASGREGSCLPYFFCSKHGGTVSGTCSLGLGQCCVVEGSCGTSLSALKSHFTSSDSTATTAAACTLSIAKADDVCQLRLNMTQLELSEPDEEGQCVRQYLEVTGGDAPSIRICGKNTGQHLVVDVRGAAGPFGVSVVNAQSNPGTAWDVQVEQLSCTSADLAPQGCSQYYTSDSGSVRSFNYATTASSSTQANGEPGSRHLQGTYQVCVRAGAGSCGLRWVAAPGESHAFTLTGNLVPNPAIPISIFNSATDKLCPFTDHLVISGGTVEGETTTSAVFCGSLFPSAVQSPSFQLTVVANDQEFADQDVDNRGFHLQYSQVPC